MATLFGVESPQYVAPSGAPAASKAQTGMLGIFPGTPDYKPPPSVSPPAPVGDATLANSATVELKVRVPGVGAVQAAVMLEPALTSALGPALFAWARDLLAGVGNAGSPPGCGPGPGSTARQRSATRERSETEARIWDRE